MGENLVSNPKMQVAIKIEPTCDKAAQLYNEFKFYRLINEKQGFPNIYWFGQWDKYNVLVMVSWPEFLTILTVSYNITTLTLGSAGQKSRRRL